MIGRVCAVMAVIRSTSPVNVKTIVVNLGA